CWTEPYGRIEHRSVSIDIPDRGSYYDAGVSLSGADAWYFITGGQALGKLAAPAAKALPSQTVTTVIQGRPVALTQSVWKNIAARVTTDKLVPTTLYEQPADPETIPSSWGSPTTVSTLEPQATGVPEMPMPCSSSNPGPTVNTLAAPATRRMASFTRATASQAKGKALLFSSAAAHGTRPIAPQAPAQERLALSFQARATGHLGERSTRSGAHVLTRAKGLEPRQAGISRAKTRIPPARGTYPAPSAWADEK
ncbi:MAG: hypothetical protein KGR26_14110, partial [Cyanobacteria bacterium REEB65]|nr:hypothetical protein [Cyanobacteria bacterium REEB65]